ncbi:SDR family NAD(P)-dependent oxidoreductase [Kribbella pittospori]|uniref:SDR family NAD(P)-dependent oxidoreductase n=1 Tax=Kribbella pittospori TaxID=722689 RepID=UPI0013F3BE68|nr:SDR family NAD(P)-dependent oxidoreductase [Kribbella pittospori]
MTGAGGGIGRAIAEELSAAGAVVAVVARSQARAGATVNAVRTAGGRAAPFSADLHDLGSVPCLIHGIERELGEVDILVNNTATVMPLGPVTGVQPAAVLRALTLNVGSVITLAGAVIPGMSRRGWGRITNISGIPGNRASTPGGNVYAACVAALESHTLNLAAELAGSGVTANAFRTQRIYTSLRAWLETIDRDHIEDPLIRRFVTSQIDVDVIDSTGPARNLLTHVLGTESGHIWDLVRNRPLRRKTPDASGDELDTSATSRPDSGRPG